MSGYVGNKVASFTLQVRDSVHSDQAAPSGVGSQKAHNVVSTLIQC